MFVPGFDFSDPSQPVLPKDPNERERFKKRRPPLHERVMTYAEEVRFNFKGEEIPIRWRLHRYPGRRIF